MNFLPLLLLFALAYTTKVIEGCPPFKKAGDWIIPKGSNCKIYLPIAINGSVIVEGNLTIYPTGGIYFVGPGKLILKQGSNIILYGAISSTNCKNECDFNTTKCENKTIYLCITTGDSDPCTEWVKIRNVTCCTDSDCPPDGWYRTSNGYEYRDYYCNTTIYSCEYKVRQSCTNDCSAGQVQYSCSGDYVIKRICGNYDSDPCTEWSSWSYIKNCNSLDGWYCSQNPYYDIREYRDYYCFGGSCRYRVTASENCDTYDGWYYTGVEECVPNGNYECGNYGVLRRLYEYRNYYCADGKCIYRVTDTFWRYESSCDLGPCPTGYICVGGFCKRAAEVCDNNKDDDGDGLIDCADPDCAGKTGPNGVICCQSDSDCPSDYTYCNGDEVWKRDYYCDLSSHTCKFRDVLVEDCNSYDKCENKVFYDYYCYNGKCVVSTKPVECCNYNDCGKAFSCLKTPPLTCSVIPYCFNPPCYYSGFYACIDHQCVKDKLVCYVDRSCQTQ